MVQIIDLDLLVDGGIVPIIWGSKNKTADGLITSFNGDYLKVLGRSPNADKINNIIYEVASSNNARGMALDVERGKAILSAEVISVRTPKSEDYSMYDSALRERGL